MSKEFIFIPDNKKLENKILDLKKENLLLLQQNIEKDKKIEELEKKIQTTIYKNKENLIEHTKNIKDLLKRKINFKIIDLNLKDTILDRKQRSYAVEILEKLMEEL